jgi:hypothetical protein
MPLINPFRYFAGISMDAVVQEIGGPEDLEYIDLAFSVVEHLIIAT